VVAGQFQDLDASIHRCPQCIGGGNVGPKGVGVFMLLELVDNKLDFVDRISFFVGEMLRKGGGAEQASKQDLRCQEQELRSKLVPVY